MFSNVKTGESNNKPKFGSASNLSVSPEVSNKISRARSVFGGSAFSLNKVNDSPIFNRRNASSAIDLTESNTNNVPKRPPTPGPTKTNARSTTPTTVKPIKMPIKFDDELKVMTQNNAPAKKNTFGHIFKNFFK